MSERDLTSNFKSGIAEVVVHPVIFCEMEFPSGTVRIWTGAGAITWDSNTWDGSEDLVSFSPMPEVTDGSSQGVTISVSGVDSDLLSDAINDDFQGSAVRIWLGCLDSSGAVVGDPFQFFGGSMDKGMVRDDGSSAVIEIQVESRLIDQIRPIQWRYTHEDQKKLYTGVTDKGLEFVPKIQDVEIVWGNN